MATSNPFIGFGRAQILSAASGVYILGDAKNSIVSRFRVSCVVTGTATYRFQTAISVIDPTVQPDFDDMAYTNAQTGVAVTGSTDQTGTGVFDVDASGLDCQIIFTTSGGGTISVIVNALIG